MTGDFSRDGALQAGDTVLQQRVAELEQQSSNLSAQVEALQAELQRAYAQARDVEYDQRATRRLLQTIVDLLPMVIGWKDQDLVYQGTNQLGATVSGVGTPDNIIGKTDYDLAWKREEAEFFRKIDREVMDSNTPQYNIIEPQQQADGKHAWLRTNKVPLHDEAGNVTGLLVTFEDITERKQAEAEVRIFQSLAENAPDGICVTTLEGHITYANPAYRTMGGYGDEIIGMPISTFIVNDRESPDSIMRHLRSHGSWQGIVSHPHSSGQTLQVSMFCIRDSTGQLQALAAIHHDITIQLRQEQERAHLQQQVIEVQQAALRELSTPLIPIADKVVVMPLIGTIDSLRAQQVLETLLEGIVTHHAEIVILDITGVQIVDTQVANTFIQAAQAVKLLGARIMMTGIQPRIAQTMVELGIDLTGIDTRNSLQAGIAAVLRQG